jgi:hypothetical protein
MRPDGVLAPDIVLASGAGDGGGGAAAAAAGLPAPGLEAARLTARGGGLGLALGGGAPHVDFGAAADDLARVAAGRAAAPTPPEAERGTAARERELPAGLGPGLGLGLGLCLAPAPPERNGGGVPRALSFLGGGLDSVATRGSEPARLGCLREEELSELEARGGVGILARADAGGVASRARAAGGDASLARTGDAPVLVDGTRGSGATVGGGASSWSLAAELRLLTEGEGDSARSSSGAADAPPEAVASEAELAPRACDAAAGAQTMQL